MRLIFLLQYLVPLAVIGLLIWWFVMRPLFTRSLEHDIKTEESEAIRERIRQAFPDDDPEQETIVSTEEIDQAINEIKDL